jgi:2-oxoglutarate dehydrogenase E1 component
MLIRAYRIRGHFHAKLDPLGLEPEKNEEELDPRSYGFQEADLDRKIFLDKVLGLEFASMREIVAILRRTYCQTLGVEFMHISSPAQKSWIQERIEGRDKEISFTVQGKRAILNKLVEAEGFEKFLDVKYTGTKRSRRWSRSSSAAAISACRKSCWECRIAAASACSRK